MWGEGSTLHVTALKRILAVVGLVTVVARLAILPVTVKKVIARIKREHATTVAREVTLLGSVQMLAKMTIEAFSDQLGNSVR